MNIKVNYTPVMETIEPDRSREFWLDEKNAANDPHEMDGYREEDI